MKLHVSVTQDEAYRAVVAEGAAAMAAKVEATIYSAEPDELVADLHRLVQSAYRMADDAQPS